MRIIKIYDYTGENCVTPGDGITIYSLVYEALTKGDVVELDFLGISVYASPFFNMAIGKLLKDFSSEQLNKRLHLTHLSDDGLAILQKVIQNANRFYADEQFRKAQSEVIKERGTEL